MSSYTAPPSSGGGHAGMTRDKAGFFHKGDFKPSCPGLYATSVLKADYVERDYDETIYSAAQCKELSFKVECHLSTAFVTATSKWVVPAALLKQGGKASACSFAVPLSPNGTVTSISASMKKKQIASCVVPVADTKGFKGTRFGRNVAEPMPTHPEVFAITIPSVPAGETVDITVTYFQPLAFVDGAYVLEAPTTLPPGALPPNAHVSSVLSFMATVRSAYPGPVAIECKTHPTTLVQAGSGVTQIMADPREGPWPNCNIVLRMPVWADHVVAAAVQQPAPRGPTQDIRSAFAIAIAPPRPERCAPFPRSVVFVQDRSGSMSGSPMDSANEALITGLRMLTPADKFNIIAFDNLQEYFSPEGLVAASSEALEAAVRWVHTACKARGTTDIMTPLQASLNMLAKSGASGSVPFVFLITDGAVDNEREICNMMIQAQQHKPVGGMATLPRVCTFGIGRYCNHYFLKMLANIGRGMSDAAFTPNRIAFQMCALLSAARAPVLTDVVLGIPGGGAGVEVYPFPIPDLFVGSPVMISGKIQGGLPPMVELKGRLASGVEWSQQVQVVEDLGNNALNIPLDKVFIKQRIDLLTGQAWLQQEKSLEAEVVSISVQYGVPSAHTQMCAFETTRRRADSLDKAQRAGKKISLAKYAVGGAAGVLVVGALAGVGFGDIGASLGNLPCDIGSVGAAMGGVLGGLDFDIPDIGGCDGCGDPAGCGDCVGGIFGDGCGDVAGGCADVGGPVLAALEPCLGSIGGCLEGVAGIAGGLFECVSGMVSENL